MEWLVTPTMARWDLKGARPVRTKAENGPTPRRAPGGGLFKNEDGRALSLSRAHFKKEIYVSRLFPSGTLVPETFPQDLSHPPGHQHQL